MIVAPIENNSHHILLDELQMQGFAKAMAQILKPGRCVLLLGEMGVGKTTFTRYLVEALGSPDPVNSPTFSLVQRYDAAFPIYHMDLYRIDSEKDLDHLALTEYFDKTEALVLVEWGERLVHLPYDFITLSFSYGESDFQRQVLVQGLV